jgi:hypothetical protein
MVALVSERELEAAAFGAHYKLVHQLGLQQVAVV